MTIAARFSRALAVLLLAWQALVVQTHLHAPAPVSTAALVAASQLSTTHHRPDDPADCPVCREIAHAGQYLTPGAPTWVAPVLVALWLNATNLSALGLKQRSHAWRSRAPPISTTS